MKASTRSHGVTGGFTLVELMVTLAIVGLLTALALPSFLDPLNRARRADAVVAALAFHQAQETWFARQGRYASLDELPALRESPQGHYRLELPVADAQGYELLLRAQGIQARDGDCAAMRAVVESGSIRFENPRPGPQGRSVRCWPQ